MRVFTPLALAALVLFALPARAQTTYTWTGLGRDVNNQPDAHWANAGNWAPAGVPGPADTAVLTNTGDPAHPEQPDFRIGVELDGAHSVGQIVLQTIRPDGGGPVLNHGTLTVTGGFSFSAGQLFGATLVCEATCTGGFSGTGIKSIAPGTLVNRGTVTWSGPTGLRLNTGTITNEGTFVLAADGPFIEQFAGGTFVNSGVLEKTGAGTTFAGWTLAFRNEGGTVRALSGTLVFSGTLGERMDAGFRGGSRFEGPGLVRLVSDPSSANVWAGTTTVAGPVEIAQGSSLRGQFALAACDGCLRWTGGEVSFDGTPAGSLVTVLPGSFLDLEPSATGGAALRGTALLNRGTVRWHGPNPLRMFTATITNEGTLDLDGAGQALANALGGTLVNRGLVVRHGPGTTSLDGSLVFRNEGATVRVTDGTLSLAAPDDGPLETTFLGGSRIEGAGLLRFRNGTNWAGTTTITGHAEMAGGSYTGDFTLAACDGCLRWTGGEVAFNAQGTSYLRVPPGGFLDIDGPADHTLRGATLVNGGTTRWHAGRLLGVNGSGTLANEGRFEAAPGGFMNTVIAQTLPDAVFALGGAGRDTLRVEGDVTLAGGTLEVTLGPALSDLLSTTNTLTLSGVALRVRVAPDYTPVLGDSRVVATTRFPITGAFADTRTLNLVNSVGFTSAVEDNRVRATATPGAVAGDEGPDAAEIPADLAIEAPAPNPFRGTARLKIGVPADGRVEVVAFDLLGRPVATLADEAMTAGWHAVEWRTDGLAAGVYVVRLRVGRETRLVRALHVR
ncbi:MAG TPA: hypothetical protein VGB53_14870 [Rubricoccaceae bacterium]|jgi:hypothetical protein